MPTYEQFKLGEVQATHFGLNGPQGLYYGFGITNQHGSPLLTASYKTEAEANAAHDAVTTALAAAVAISTPG